MEEYEFALIDRIDAIRKADQKYNLRENAYLSFSGGKDSMTVHRLLDLALPGNRIPRVYSDTGIEYAMMREFVLGLQKGDDRITVIRPNKPIKATLERVGYPFKSKEHSLRVDQFNKGSTAYFIQRYLTGRNKDGSESRFACPKMLLYQFAERGRYHYSSKCCEELKKKPFRQYEKASGKTIRIDGMMAEEGGNRARLDCFSMKNGRVAFHPLIKSTYEWCAEFRERERVPQCGLYSAPFNFRRTGCKGCPYSLDLQEQLTTMARYLPAEREQCEIIWKPVYEEYRRIGYRLDKDEQLRLF